MDLLPLSDMISLWLIMAFLFALSYLPSPGGKLYETSQILDNLA